MSGLEAIRNRLTDDKYIGVIVHYDYGLGFGSQMYNTKYTVEIITDKELIDSVLNKDYNAFIHRWGELEEMYFKEQYIGITPDQSMFKSLFVEVISKGTAIRINNHDGYESIEYVGCLLGE